MTIAVQNAVMHDRHNAMLIATSTTTSIILLAVTLTMQLTNGVLNTNGLLSMLL